MIDSHLHLNDKRFNNLDKVIQDARQAGVRILVISGYDYASSLEAIRISQKYPEVFASVGLHPSEVSKEKYNVEEYRKLSMAPKVIAIGEIGLDYYWDKTYKELQKELFHKQLTLASDINKPVIIHSREAIQDTYDILKQYKLKGIMHCYSGSLEMAKLFTKLGYLLGIGGVITFKGASLREVVKEISLEYLISETDSPYLAPHPYRGKLNEPKYIPIIVSEIASLKNISPEKIVKEIRNNFIKLFPIKELT